jgi:hypothetical protein
MHISGTEIHNLYVYFKHQLCFKTYNEVMSIKNDCNIAEMVKIYYYLFFN